MPVRSASPSAGDCPFSQSGVRVSALAIAPRDCEGVPVGWLAPLAAVEGRDGRFEVPPAQPLALFPANLGLVRHQLLWVGWRAAAFWGDIHGHKDGVPRLARAVADPRLAHPGSAFSPARSRRPERCGPTPVGCAHPGGSTACATFPPRCHPPTTRSSAASSSLASYTRVGYLPTSVEYSRWLNSVPARSLKPRLYARQRNRRQPNAVRSRRAVAVVDLQWGQVIVASSLLEGKSTCGTPECQGGVSSERTRHSTPSLKGKTARLSAPPIRLFLPHWSRVCH
jgi:hypothetical protein